MYWKLVVDNKNLCVCTAPDSEVAEIVFNALVKDGSIKFEGDIKEHIEEASIDEYAEFLIEGALNS